MTATPEASRATRLDAMGFTRGDDGYAPAIVDKAAVAVSRNFGKDIEELKAKPRIGFVLSPGERWHSNRDADSKSASPKRFGRRRATVAGAESLVLVEALGEANVMTVVP